MDNPVLKAIRERRSIFRFKSSQIEDKKIQAILEAGRWAPSWLNKQPWRFIIVQNEDVKEEMSRIVPSVFSLSIKDAPLCIAICVDPEADPYHFIEDGSAATQNMALAAHSLDLGTIWIGVFSLANERKSTERKLKEILKIPKDWRIISLLPVGVSKLRHTKPRKKLSQLTDWNEFKSGNEQKLQSKPMEKPTSVVKKILEPVSTPPI